MDNQKARLGGHLDVEFSFNARGHEHVTACHASTLEVTTEDWLTPAGDCIVGVEAELAPVDFPEEFRRRCQASQTRIEIVLEAANCQQRIVGRGDTALTFESDRSMVCRTSTYVDDRTVLVNADVAAKDIDRQLITALQRGAPLSVRMHASPAPA